MPSVNTSNDSTICGPKQGTSFRTRAFFSRQSPSSFRSFRELRDKIRPIARENLVTNEGERGKGGGKKRNTEKTGFTFGTVYPTAYLRATYIFFCKHAPENLSRSLLPAGRIVQRDTGIPELYRPSCRYSSGISRGAEMAAVNQSRKLSCSELPLY